MGSINYLVLFSLFYCAITITVVHCTPDHEPMNVVVAEPQYQVLDDAKKEELKVEEVKPEEPKKTEGHHHHDDNKGDPLSGLDLISGPQYQYLVVKKEEKKNETTIRHHHEHEDIYAINTGADEPEFHAVTIKKEHRRKDDKGIEHHHKKETSFTKISTNTKKSNTKEQPKSQLLKNDVTSPSRPYFYTPYQPSKNQYTYNPFQMFQAYPFGYQQYQPYRSASYPHYQYPYNSYPSYRNFMYPYYK